MDVGAGMYLTCVQFDAATSTCTQTAWMPPPTLIPPMSSEAGQTLGIAIFSGLVAIAVSKLPRRGM